MRLKMMPAALAVLAASVAVCGCLCSPESKDSSFRTAALDAGLWKKSEWISAPDAPLVTPELKKLNRAASGTSWFVSELKNGKAVKSARWMTTGLGVYRIYINGVEVGEDALKPGFTHVAKTRRSFTYDVTALMNTAEGAKNSFSAEVSSGWWRDKIVGYAGKKSAFRAVLEVEYADGTKKVFGTGKAGWKSRVGGPVLCAGIFDGEDYDAGVKPIYGFCNGDAGFKTPEINNEFKGEILPSDGAEIVYRHDLTLKPVEAYTWKGVEGEDEARKVYGRVRKVRDGFNKLLKGETLVVDFGQNAAAVPAFRFRAANGTVLECLSGEMMNDMNGERSRGNDGPGGSVYRANLRIPSTGMRLRYTFGGDGREWSTYMPMHTFFGYRYITVTATDDVEFESIVSVPVTSITKEMETGSLVTGDKDVNKLVSNIYWGQLSNYLSVPTDCPQRNERLGWSADTQVFTEAGAFNADTRKFFHKWTRDLRDSRCKDGGFPSVAPRAQYGNDTFNLGWADAGVIVPYQIWKQFGDTKIIDENFEAMEKFVRKIDEMKYDIESTGAFIYADWLSYEKFESCGNKFGSWRKWGKDPDARNYRRYLAACYWLYDAGLMVRMAEATGRDATWFRESEKRALKYIRSKFLESDGLLLKPMRDIQTACLFALRFGVVEGDAVEKTKAILLKSIKDHGDCLQTGFLGTSILMETLTMSGMNDVAYTLLLQHRSPSWLYSVDQGATTIWERWNSYTKETGFGAVGMNSFNHYAYGAVLAWMYKEMAGIAADPGAPGFRNIVMAPKPDRRIGFVKAEYRSAAGLIKSHWEYKGDKWEWRFSIPAGATADVTLPGEKTSKRYVAGDYSVSLDAK